MVKPDEFPYCSIPHGRFILRLISHWFGFLMRAPKIANLTLYLLPSKSCISSKIKPQGHQGLSNNLKWNLLGIHLPSRLPLSVNFQLLWMSSFLSCSEKWFLNILYIPFIYFGCFQQGIIQDTWSSCCWSWQSATPHFKQLTFS